MHRFQRTPSLSRRRSRRQPEGQRTLKRGLAWALSRGDWILSDRFTDATYAYQGGGHFVAAEFLHSLERGVHPDCNPDLTLLFDVPPDVSRQRLAHSESKGRELDKFERESGTFFERVRAAYFDRARAEPSRFRIIDATRPVADVRQHVPPN